ncbi:hypothetical protein L228DRAFT_259471 [Xylona heveae TC161]|uniref:AA1-like domain-containing protein n=1 Tax=Xylona heveae (strain CBS 132557 / TC161) TaxID=1328760 RepID=A0A165I1H2_XYLHT|nr:hypothetical protein L228DRAFT_259471 [Xylona heveae TC161]KZF24223.1 hypothetical protein L228DRAFT_259471 [Xylona heveae TC161]
MKVIGALVSLVTGLSLVAGSRIKVQDVDIFSATADTTLSYNPGGPIQFCTSTLTRLGTFTHGPTSTTYKHTSTSASSLDCNGCSYLSVTTKDLGVGPPVKYTTTVTKPVTTTTEFVCATSTS